MNHITNTIEVEYEHFLLEVDYDWTKGNSGDYYNPPEPQETIIKKVVVIGHIDDNGFYTYFEKPIMFNMNQECQDLIVNEISDNVESMM